MKSTLLLVSTVLAATAALVTLVPVNTLASVGNALVALGILAIFAIDYSGVLRPVRAPAQILAFEPGTRVPLDLGRAA
jgi:hypothetical protein